MEINRLKSLRLLSTAYYVNHGISKVALDNFLLMREASSNNAPLPKEMKSAYTLLKPYEHLKKTLRKIFVCQSKSCSKILVNGSNGLPTKFQTCGHKYDPREKSCFTLMLPVEDQLKFFLKNHQPKRSSFDNDNGKIGDVTTGQSYKKLMNKLGEDAHSTLTLQLNVDGAQMFQSSKWNFWPFMAIINEAAYKVRRSNVVLVGLWHGDRKPPMNAFVRPCVESLAKLKEPGLEFNGTTVKILPTILTTDMMARPVFRNTTQFNGSYGCDFCLHPGWFLLMLKNWCQLYY